MRKLATILSLFLLLAVCLYGQTGLIHGSGDPRLKGPESQCGGGRYIDDVTHIYYIPVSDNPCVWGPASGAGGGSLGCTGASGNISCATVAASASVITDPLKINKANALLVIDGASVDAGSCAAGPWSSTVCTSGTPLAHGGYEGNYGEFLSQSKWCANGCTYYNNAFPGGTTPGTLTHYFTGNSFTGVTVPSPHSLSPAVTGSTNPAYYIMTAGIALNDCTNGSIPVGTTISNFQTLVADAQADGYFVVIMTPTFGALLDPAFGQIAQCQTQLITVAQALRDHTIAADMVVDAWEWIPDTTDHNMMGFTAHPSALGHAKIEANLENCLRMGGCPTNWTGPIDQRLNASMALTLATQTANYTLAATDAVENFQGTSITLTLPNLTGVNSGPYFIYNNTLSSNALTIAPASGATLVGVPTSLYPGSGVIIYNTSGFWFVLGSNMPASLLRLNFAVFSASHTVSISDSVIGLNAGATVLTLPSLAAPFGPVYVYNNTGAAVTLTLSGATGINIPATLPSGASIALEVPVTGFWTTLGTGAFPPVSLALAIATSTASTRTVAVGDSVLGLNAGVTTLSLPVLAVAPYGPVFVYNNTGGAVTVTLTGTTGVNVPAVLPSGASLTLDYAAGGFWLNVGTTLPGAPVTTAGTAVAAGTCQAQTGLTVTGTKTTSTVTWSIPTALPAAWQTGIHVVPVVTANTVTLNLCNPTAGSITPDAQVVNVRVTP